MVIILWVWLPLYKWIFWSLNNFQRIVRFLWVWARTLLDYVYLDLLLFFATIFRRMWRWIVYLSVLLITSLASFILILQGSQLSFLLLNLQHVHMLGLQKLLQHLRSTWKDPRDWNPMKHSHLILDWMIDVLNLHLVDTRYLLLCLLAGGVLLFSDVDNANNLVFWLLHII